MPAIIPAIFRVGGLAPTISDAIDSTACVRAGDLDVAVMQDIATEADVRCLVDAFYGAIREDALLNPIFTDVAQVDWAEHLPKMYAFWNGLILGVPGYAGRPFPPHTVLPVGREHFVRWVQLFHRTVDQNFAGPGAQRAKDAAASIAHTFAMRMGKIDPINGVLL